MFKFDTQFDFKEAASLEMRRKKEEERKNRIFNPKVRQIGIDKQSLENQIREKHNIEEANKRIENAFAAEAIKNDKIAQLLDKRLEEDRRQLNFATNEFRLQHQTPNCRREFELNDPNLLKKDVPARISDHDPRCGPASIQKFEGEDLHFDERRKEQSTQIRHWVEQQVREKKTAEDNQKLADNLYEAKMIDLDRRALQLQQAQEECSRSIREATDQYNKALKKEQMIKDAYKRRQEEEDKRTEIANHLYGDFLTENPDAAMSAFGAHRVMPDRWKGMTQSQVAEVRRVQEQQRFAAERRRCEEEEKKRQEELIRVAQEKELMRQERDLEKKKREMAKQLAEENLRIATNHYKQQRLLNYDLTHNEPAPSYFTQFNTSTR